MSHDLSFCARHNWTGHGPCPPCTEEPAQAEAREASPPVEDERRDELRWTDQTQDHGGVVGYAEMHREQPDAPVDAVALIETGHKGGDGFACDAAYLTAEQAVEAALILLESAERWRCEQNPMDGPQAIPDQRQRWRLHVCASSIKDMTFWIEHDENGHRATEVESGVSGAHAVTAREAMENYWNLGAAPRDPGVLDPEGIEAAARALFETANSQDLGPGDEPETWDEWRRSSPTEPTYEQYVEAISAAVTAYLGAARPDAGQR